ncbi:hypothetical protein ElyMa_002119100 [Elysia marginata]|uniref:Uncharacterized protein n=1 Tax=Elysia marginata TaxID=1093978 RepID=A0AAV4FIV5_9GAST|nr:hypothetical protein ElyMa_002119100 [Elysia marginata]
MHGMFYHLYAEDTQMYCSNKIENWPLFLSKTSDSVESIKEWMTTNKLKRNDGHLRRHDSIQKRILEGKIDGRRGRGRRRQTWLGNIQEMSQMKICEVCETALDRRRWRTVTAHLGDGMAPS